MLDPGPLVDHQGGVAVVEPGDVADPGQPGGDGPDQIRPHDNCVLHSHWSRSNEARRSLVESFSVLLAPSVLCHKEPARASKNPLLGALLLVGILCSFFMAYGRL